MPHLHHFPIQNLIYFHALHFGFNNIIKIYILVLSKINWYNTMKIPFPGKSVMTLNCTIAFLCMLQICLGFIPDFFSGYTAQCLNPQYPAV